MEVVVVMIIISIHIFPQELTEYKRLMLSLNVASSYVKDIAQFKILTTLNINESLTKLGNDSSNIVKSFRKINEESQFGYDELITSEKNFLGVNEHRNQTIDYSTTTDSIIFLDSDIHFNSKILAHHENANSVLSNKHDHYIITPNVVRLWDSTWDCIVHESFNNKSHNFYKSVNCDLIEKHKFGKVQLVPNNTFKWGGGWFNCINADLLKKIKIPNTFKGYGPDDTFIMECCKIMKANKYDVQQYILKNMVVCESPAPIKNNPRLRSDIPNFREESNKHFHTEINKFSKKL